MGVRDEDSGWESDFGCIDEKMEIAQALVLRDVRAGLILHFLNVVLVCEPD